MDHAAPALRAAIGLAAVAMTALVVAVTVIAPAKVGSARPDSPAQTMSRAAAPTEVAIVPSRIDVVGRRDATVVSAQGSQLPATAKQEI